LKPEEKTRLDTCTVCGEEMPRVATWGPEWLVSRYCSKSCSETRMAPLDYRLQEAILQLLRHRSGGESLNLEEVARFVDPFGWESLMQRAQNAARRLAANGDLMIEGPIAEGAVLWSSEEIRLRLPN